MCCHAEFGVAGSTDPARRDKVRIVVTDVQGRRAEMVPNPFGNFFRHVRLQPPLAAVLIDASGSTRVMKAKAPHGDCNACHGIAGAADPL